MEKICDSYSTGALYDFVSRSENLEEYRNILESLADQKQNWTYIINDIMKERGLSASKMAELCGVSRQSVQKWLKGSVPKSRETYIKIGFAAHYNLKQMNYFLQRYGCVNKLYPKYLEDSVCIFVLSSDCIEHSYQACEKVINMIKNEIFDDVPRSEGKEYTTSALELDITNLRSLQEMVSFVKEHAQMYKQKYYRLYRYIEDCIQKNLLPDEEDNVSLLASSQQWSSSLRQCVSEISQKKWYPQRNKIISLGIHLNLDVDQINEMLELAQMEKLCAKTPFENAIIYALENAKLEYQIHCDGTNDLCLYVRKILLSLEFEGVEFFLNELPEEE